MPSFEPPTPALPVSVADAIDSISIGEKSRTRLLARAERYVSELLLLPTAGPDFAIKADQLSNVGRREIAALVDLPSRLVAPADGSSGKDLIAPAFRRLREILEDLDPARNEDLLAPRRILGFFPRSSGIATYLRRYEAAQRAIEGILRMLAAGRDAVMRDNIAIEGERRRMWALIKDLAVAIQGSRRLDEGLERAAAAMESREPDRALAVRERALFRIRQRSTDLLTQMAVSLQAYMALDVVRRTNEELVGGIERASTTSIAVLHTAAAVARALAGQTLGLDLLDGLDGGGSVKLGHVGGRLSDEGSRIMERSRGADLETLRQAFVDVWSTLDDVDATRGGRATA